LISVSGIGVILMAILLGPIFSPPEFSWLHHSTSEQAGQRLAGAWIMRAGFVGYGLGTLLAALADWPTRPFVRAALVLFGLGLIGTAIWSNASILPIVQSDMHEDWMHSVASGIVGTAFAAACAARLFGPRGVRSDTLAWAGLIMAVVVPIAMGVVPDLRGLLQRTMFAVSFVFVIREFAVPDRKPAAHQ
jgi:MFS family permease